jgi:hypothetical protein
LHSKQNYIFKSYAILPTDNIVIGLDRLDEPWISSLNLLMFSDIQNAKLLEETTFLVQVVEVSSIRSSSDKRYSREQTIRLEDNKQGVISLVLYDNEVYLSYLFKKVCFNF